MSVVVSLGQRFVILVTQDDRGGGRGTEAIGPGADDAVVAASGTGIVQCLVAGEVNALAGLLKGLQAGHEGRKEQAKTALQLGGDTVGGDV